MENRKSVSISAFATKGEVNGDGIDDFVLLTVGSRSGVSDKGVRYVLFGNKNGFLPVFDLNSMTADQGSRIIETVKML